MREFKITSTKNNTVLFKGTYPSFKACLEGAVHQSINLSYSNLRGHNLSNANLDDARLPYSDFTGANLTGANLSEAQLHSAIFDDCALFNTCFAYSHISKCSFKNAQFGGSDVTGARMDTSNFEGSSCFSLNLMATASMKNCLFTDEHGKQKTFSTPPIVIFGTGRGPLVIFDDRIYNAGALTPSSARTNTIRTIQNIAKNTL